MVWDREWESVSVMDAAYGRLPTYSETWRLDQCSLEIYDGERI